MLSSPLAPAHAASARAAVAPDAEAIRIVLELLRERGMDVVFVGQYTDGERRFRVVEALSHGRAAAMATGRPVDGNGHGVLLDTPVVLRDGRVHGMLCCYSAGSDPATTDRDLRSLRHGARLAARLLDNEQVLRELSRQSFSH
jgi:GAF domain-containing protein